MKKSIITAIALILMGSTVSLADPLTWQTPAGTFGLPFKSTEVVAAYDGVLKEALAGVSLPVYTDPKGIISLQVGAVAPWQTNGFVEPYVALGHDIAREIPVLQNYQSLHLNAFGRYDSNTGRAGAGISASYSFAG